MESMPEKIMQELYKWESLSKIKKEGTSSPHLLNDSFQKVGC